MLKTAYRLFQREGLHSVGVDRIVAESGVAKTTLYRHFGSKDDLTRAVLELHNELWTHGWLIEEVERRAETPAARILAVFDAFDAWFRSDDFNGCFFLNTLLEARVHGTIHTATHEALEELRGVVAAWAKEAGAPEPRRLAAELHVLMMGSVAAAVDGDLGAAQRAQPVARIMLEREGIAV